MAGEIVIRGAEPADVPTLFALIVELAEYERLTHEVAGSVEALGAALFGPAPAAEAIVAAVDGQPAGFALYFRTFSTFLCQPGLWLEDIFVRPAYRRIGVGRGLMSHLAALAVERGYGRIDWSALTWNELALAFYDRLGARMLREWQQMRLDGEGLLRLSQR